MVQGGPGKFVIGGCLLPPLPPPLQKILTGFLRFAWTPLGSSGGSRPRTSPASYAAGRDQQVSLRQARLILGWVTVCGQVHHLGM